MKKLAMLADPEQLAWFEELLEKAPLLAELPLVRARWERDLDGRRVLCLQVRCPGAPTDAFCHYHPEGFSEAAIQELTHRHGTDTATVVSTHRD